MNDKELLALGKMVYETIIRSADTYIGCSGCKYVGKEAWEMPCSDCRNAYISHWRLREEQEDE